MPNEGREWEKETILASHEKETIVAGGAQLRY